MQETARVPTWLTSVRKVLVTCSTALLAGTVLTATVTEQAAQPTPSETVAPTATAEGSETPEAVTPEPAPRDTSSIPFDAVAPLETEATITVRVRGGHHSTTTSAPLAGVTLRLHTGDATGPAEPVTADWATCTSDAAGYCVFSVPETHPGTTGTPPGANHDAHFWVITRSAPTGWQQHPELRTTTGHAAFRTAEQLHAGQHYETTIDFAPDDDARQDSDDAPDAALPPAPPTAITLEHHAQPYGGTTMPAADWPVRLTLNGHDLELSTNGSGTLRYDLNFPHPDKPFELTVTPLLSADQHAAGWELTELSCTRQGHPETGSTLTVTPGDRVACTSRATQTLTPGISITKVATGEHASTPTRMLAGTALTWTYTVTNTGQTPLSGVVVGDDQLPAATIHCPTDTLAAGASMTCTATGTVIAHH